MNLLLSVFLERKTAVESDRNVSSKSNRCKMELICVCHSCKEDHSREKHNRQLKINN